MCYCLNAHLQGQKVKYAHCVFFSGEQILSTRWAKAREQEI